MARKATLIGEVVDCFGDRWDVREKRPTAHGFDVLIGWPTGQPRGAGGSGGPRVIVTDDLATHLRRHADTYAVDLPIGRNAVVRLRRLLGLSARDEHDAWWFERLGDLMRMTFQEFSQKYGVSDSTACLRAQRYFGRRSRENGWWQSPDVVEALSLGTAAAADVLGVSVATVRRLKNEVKKMGGYRYNWTPEAEALLGTDSDQKIANVLSTNQTTVATRRRQLGIDAYRPKRTVDWTPEIVEMLGTVPDHLIADRLGVSRITVMNKRTALGINAVSKAQGADGKLSAGYKVVIDDSLSDKIERLAPVLVERYRALGVPIKRLEQIQVIEAAVDYMLGHAEAGKLR